MSWVGWTTYKETVKILDWLQEPQKTVSKSLDARQTKSMDGRQTKSIRVRAELAALGRPGWLARFTVKTGNNGRLTAVCQLENSNKDLNIQKLIQKYIAGMQSDSTRLTNILIQRKVYYMKQNCKRDFLSLNV